jgi:hypothetical protein
MVINWTSEVEMFVVTTLTFIDDHKHADASTSVEGLFFNEEAAYKAACGVLIPHMRERIDWHNNPLPEMKGWTKGERTWKEFFTYLTDLRELWELSVEWFGPQNTMKTGIYVYVTEKPIPKIYTVTSFYFDDDYKRADVSCKVIGCYHDLEKAYEAAVLPLAEYMHDWIENWVADGKYVTDEVSLLGPEFTIEKLKVWGSWEQIHIRLNEIRYEMDLFRPEYTMKRGRYTEVEEVEVL